MTLSAGKVQYQLHHADQGAHEYQSEQQTHPDEVGHLAAAEIPLAVGVALYAEERRGGAFHQLPEAEMAVLFVAIIVGGGQNRVLQNRVGSGIVAAPVR